MNQLKKDIEIKKAQAMRHMKPMCKTYNLDDMMGSLEGICEEIDEIRWAIDNDGNDILPEMLGDDDEAAEFKNEFCSLAVDASRLMEDIQEQYITDDFNDVAISLSANDDGMMGYDSYECDYFPLMLCEYGDAVDEADKRIMRMKKADIVTTFRTVQHIILGYASVFQRYTMLKAGFDIIREKNDLHVDTAKAIEDLYEKMEAEQYSDKYEREWDMLVESMPDTAWIQ